MRLVMIASTIALGLVAGLSQASDWRENPFAAQVDRTDQGHPNNPGKERATRGVTYKTGYDTSYTSYEIGPALGYLVLGGASAETDRGRALGVGLALAITDQLSVNGEALGPDLRNNTYIAPGTQSGRFIVRAAFRF